VFSLLYTFIYAILTAIIKLTGGVSPLNASVPPVNENLHFKFNILFTTLFDIIPEPEYERRFVLVIV
jgi:hypothetical protein